MKRLFLFFLLMLLAPKALPAAEYSVAHDIWPPFAFMDKNGQVIGYNVDYINAIGKEAGFSAVNMHITWDSLFTSLAQGRVHIIASSVTITEERKQSMGFSDPYFETEQHLLLPESSAVTSFEDLKKGAVIGVQGGTTCQTTVNARKDLTARLYDDVAEAVDDLADGKYLDGVVCDAYVAMYYALAHPYRGKIKLASFPISDTKEHYGFVVRKDDTRLLQKINAGIAAMRKKGVDAQLYAKWFRKDTPPR